MKKLIIIIIGFLFVIQFANGQTPIIPEKTDKFINDFANIIPDDKEDLLLQTCNQIQKESSTQVVIVTTDDVPKDYPIENYSIDLANKWGIGQKGVNNGLLILIFPKNHKSRVEVGYGLEGVLTDALTSRMQSDYFKPNFRQGDFYTGIQQILYAIKFNISPEAIQQQKMFAQQKEKESQMFWSNFWDTVMLFLIIGLIIILIVFLIKNYVKKQEVKRLIEEERIKNLEKAEKERIKKEDLLKKNSELLKNEFIEKFRYNSGILETNIDFLNSKNILEEITQLYSYTNTKINNAKFEEYNNIIPAVLIQFDGLTKNIFDNIKIKDSVNSIINNLNEFKIKFENTLNSTIQLMNKYDNSIWLNNFTKEELNLDYCYKQINLLDDLYFNAQSEISNNEFKKASDLVIKIKNEIDLSYTLNNKIENISNSVVLAIDYINNSQTNFNKIIKQIDATMLHIYVTNGIREEWNLTKSNLKFSKIENFTNPIEEKLKLENVFNTILQYEKPALTDIKRKEEELRAEQEKKRIIEEADRKRKADKKRKEEEEEEDNRRRRNSYSSSYDSSSSSSYGSSSSSSSSSSDFGGGSFGGGGSSSDW